MRTITTDRCLTIDLDYIVAECVICGDVSDRMGIPVYEDLVLPNDWPGEHGGAPACERCMKLQWTLTKPMTFFQFRKRVEVPR